MKKKNIIIFALLIVIFCSTASTAQNDHATHNNNLISSSTGDKWAVLVGISDYYGTENDLSFTYKDALDMKNTLITHGWESDHILVLLNSSATKPNIQNAIENWLGSNVSAEDTVLFFYSGHGTYYSESQYNPDGDDEIDGKDEYLCSYSESMQIEDFIADGELDQYLDTLESEHIAVIIDSCFSGGMTKAVVLQADEKNIDMNKTLMISGCEIIDPATTKTIKKPEVFIIDGLSKDIGGDARVVLMACNDGEHSLELSGFKNGIFTHYIVEGLQCMADADSSGNITAEEVFAYAEPLIIRMSEELGHVQHPQIYDSYSQDLHITGDLSSTLITVDDSGGADYTSIQEAVDAAQSCDTVYVYSGMYNESVLINKPVTVQGEGVDVVTINGDGNPGIILIAHHATVTGFTIEGAGKYAGIEVDYSHLCTISNNNISRNGCGVLLTHSSDNVISDNTGNDNTDLDGVSLWYSCCNNLIMNNTVNSNRWSGVYLYSKCNNNTISNNIANGNRDPGILLDKSSNDNLLIGNTADLNKRDGIYVRSSNNCTLKNNILHNNKYNLIIDGDAIHHYYHTIDTTNTVNNKPVYYLVEQTDIEISKSSNAGYLGLVSCDNITVEGLNITDNRHGIFLINTTNSILTKNSVSNNRNGVYLKYSSTNIFESNNITSNYDGIVLYNSENNSIKNNNISMCHKKGIDINDYSNDNIIYNNNINNNEDGIYLSGISGNTIYNNTISDNTYGIYLYKNSGNNISQNRLNNNKIAGFYFNIYETYYNNIKDNLVNGDIYYHYVNEKDLIIQDIISTGDNPSNLGWVSLINCTNISVCNVTLDNNSLTWYGDGSGLYVYKTQNSVFNNISVNKNKFGIYLSSSSNITITNCIASNSWSCGIYFDNSPNNGIINNILYSNDAGIYLKNSNNNLIYYNNLTDNNKQAHDDHGTSIWDNGPFIGGNYWNDYNGIDSDGNGIGDTPYTIDGDSQDNYPLVNWSEGLEVVLINSPQTDKMGYIIDEDIQISCFIQNSRMHNFTPDEVYAVIEKPDQNTEQVLLTETMTGNYVGTFTNSSLIGIYNIIIYANKEGAINDTTELFFEVAQFHLDDWVVNTTQIRCNDTIILSGDLIIENGGNLTLRNVKLKINCDHDGQYRIEVKDGGALYIYDNDNDPATMDDASVITALDPEYEYLFWVNKGSSFQMMNSELHECGYEWDSYFKSGGLRINSENAVIENNLITDNYYGIILYNSINSTLDNNDIKYNTCIGILLAKSDKNTIINCNVHSNADNGFYLDHSDNNLIENNEIRNNTKNGFYLHCSDNNMLINNILYSNDAGIYLENSNNNLIYHNNLTDNNKQAHDDHGTSIWDHGPFIGGNYWNDYNGIDSDGNGIGDTPYTIDGDSQDNYPLVNWSEGLEVVLINSPQTDKMVYIIDEDIQISCFIQNSLMHNITPDEVYAVIEKPDQNTEQVLLTETMTGNYVGTFTNSSLIGTYNIIIYANKDGDINDTAELFFEVAHFHLDDWVVNTTQIRCNDTIILSGDLIIENGGNLTLRNVKLKINCDHDGQYRIEVKDGGALYIYDNDNDPATMDDASVITALDPEYEYLFWVNKGSSFQMMNSELHECGYKRDSYFKSGGLRINSENAVIENNLITDNYYGIILYNSINSTLDNNDIKYNTCIGILLAKSDKNTIINCNVHSNADNGFYLDHSDNNLIENNEIRNNTKNGFGLSHSDNNMLINNEIKNNSHCGFNLYVSYKNILDNNEIKYNTYDGIRLGKSDKNTIINCNVHSNADNGFYLSYSDNNLIENNEIRNNTKNGFGLSHSDNNLIENNEIRNNTKNGFGLFHSDNNLIENNEIRNNTKNGFGLSHSDNNMLINNEIKNNSHRGFNLYESYKNILDNNEIKYNTYNGIRLEKSDKNTINNCNISYNTDDGITLYKDNDDNTIINNNLYSNKNGIILRYSSYNNLLYCNNFYNNTNKNAHDECANHWNSSTHGNYWDDYNGSDADLNGIGDTPYPIPGGSNIDNYPLIQPWIAVNTSMSIFIDFAVVDINDTIILPITIENAVDIQQVTLDLDYDQDVVSIINITANDTVLSSTVTYTLNTGSAAIDLTNPDNITVTSATPIIDITFQAGENTGVTALQLQNVEVVDNTGSHAPDTVVDGSLTVCIKGDFNNNNKVDIGDVARVAFMVAEKVPEDLRADFNNNGCVDVGDAAKISFYLAEKVSEL